MNLIIISQDKKSIWDFSQCCIFIPNDSIHEIFIRPYYAPNGNMRLEDVEAAKNYFDNLNGEKFIVSDKKFNITPIGNNYNLIYKLPEDVKI